MTTTIKGELEIDHDRGVIYFHSDQGYSVLRICRLPKPIPPAGAVIHRMLDINFNPTSCSWLGKVETGE